jgi:hypothetical protein
MIISLDIPTPESADPGAERRAERANHDRDVPQHVAHLADSLKQLSVINHQFSVSALKTER